MKSIVLTLLFLPLFAIKTYGQINAPYYQSFDKEFDFWRVSELNPVVPNYNVRHWDLERWAPRKQSNYINVYWNVTGNGDTVGYPELPGVKRDLKPYELISWDEPERYGFETGPNGRKGKVLKLTTLDQYDNSGGIADVCRSRTEVKTFPFHGEGDEFYYSWSFYIPDDERHRDDIASDNIIAQWHEQNGTTWEDNRNMQPPFFMTFKNDTDRLGSDNKRDVHIMYGYRYSDNGNQGNFKSFTIPNAVEKGQWQDVIMHIKWSAKPSNAFMEMWINNLKVTDLSTGEDRFYNANLYKDAAMLIPQPNYFKLGQYRQGQKLSQSIFIDEFRIGRSKEEVNLRTSLIADDCNRILTYDNMKIHCHNVIGAKGYHFYFPNENIIVYSENPTLDLALLEWIELGKTYNVRCRVALYEESNTTDLFGAICKVITPPPFKTKLTDDYCDKTLTSDLFTVKAYPVPGAIQYKFYVSGVTNPIEKNEPFIKLDDYDWFHYNSSYQVSVRVSLPDDAGLINHIGESCTVFTPLKTQLRNEYCGNILNSNDFIVRAYPVAEAIQYKFYVSGVPNPIERDEPFLKLDDYDWFHYNSAYQIGVRVSIPDNKGEINHIGKTCYVTTSESPQSIELNGNNFSADKNVVENGLLIYPNPSRGDIFIGGMDTDNMKIDLLGINGEKIEFQRFRNGSDVLIKTEYKGVVIIYLEKMGKVFVSKVLVR